MNTISLCYRCRLRTSAYLDLHSKSYLALKRGYASYRDPEVNERDNPILAAYLQRKRDREAAAATRKQKGSSEEEPDNADEGEGPAPSSGALAPNSILNDPLADAALRAAAKGSALGQAIPASRLLKLDPMPHRRRRWERKMTIREIVKRGRLTKAQVIKRTERAHLSRSDFLKTSIKKLSPLANQISGKKIEDAIVQMRFSKKKAAIQIREHLERARDEAIVRRGMGLGQAEGRAGLQAIVKTKDGKRLNVKDRTAIYVDQAWVNRGPYGQDKNSRARGRIDRLRLPQTSMSVLLKEEATRVREHLERVAKEKSKKVWVPLPDRPITEQRQYYCW